MSKPILRPMYCVKCNHKLTIHRFDLKKFEWQCTECEKEGVKTQ
jgi:ribosomal protein L37AE/L43A